MTDHPASSDDGPDCPIVAIGASAGGIKALQQFFEAMPENPGIAFVVVLHLSPSHESHLAEILQRSTSLDIVQVDDTPKIEPNCVYVIAPNSVLTIADGRLSTRPPNNQHERRHPVDAIFASVAEACGARAISVILSGTGSNGSAGAQAVRERDGVVLAQDPATAEYAEMPRNVILSGLADRVLAPAEMGAVLVGYVQGSLKLIDRKEEELARTIAPDLNSILSILRSRGHHDFAPYKKKTLVRRILRRMGLGQIDDFGTYATRLRNDPDEVHALIADLLINVTSFFRDPEAWDVLREKVIAPMVDSRGYDQPVRVWVPACSTGEEAYTIAMMLLERAEEAEKSLDVKVFATDAAPQALARARAGVFPATIAETIPARRLERFFDKENEVYRAKKELRESVIFAPQNLLADPPFSRLDLVSCRNLLIYLEPQVQERVIALLHFSLREGGYLFLGTAETVGQHTDLFQPISKKWRIYQRIGGTRHDLVDFPLLGAEHHAQLERASGSSGRRNAGDDAREALVATFAPPSVLVDDRGRILYYHGDLDRYLRTPSGEPTIDLMVLVREELRAKLRAALRHAAKERLPISVDASTGEPDKERIRLSVAPISQRGSPTRFLVSFEEHRPSAQAGAASQRADERILSEDQLEEELKSTREELRLSVEQLETSNEELKASNEEITSMNEELQSTNEELETSKEELQSLNEELNTVNVQLQSKVEELEDRTNDLNNLLNSTDIATLFLDEQFRIRWFSPLVRNLFQVIQTDIGRPITDFAQRFEDDSFLVDCREVLRNLQPRDKEVRGPEDTWYLQRILPYRTDDNRIAGVVATFTDITERKKWEDALAASKTYSERIVDTIRQSFVVLDENLIVRSANRAFYECFEIPADQAQGRVLFEVNNGDWDIPELRRALRESIPDSGILDDIEVTHTFRDLGTRHLEINVRRLEEDFLLLVAIEDVTERKDAEANREFLLSELQHRIKNILAKVTAIVTLSQGGHTSVPEFAEELKRRLVAIARTENLIGGRADRIGLRELIEAETRSFDGDQTVRIEGPEVLLSSSVAQTMALALHELATNAVKYGTFTVPDGTLDVTWSVDRDASPALLRFRWREGNVSPPAAGEEGFGSKLLKRIVPQMLGGSGTLDFVDGGLVCEIAAPLPDAAAEAPPDSAARRRLRAGE